MRGLRLYTSVIALTVLSACGDNTMNPATDGSGGGGHLTLVFQHSNPPEATGLSLTQASVHVEAIAVIGDTTPDYRTMLLESDVDMLGAPKSHLFDQAPQGLYSRVHFKVEEISFQGTYNGMPIQANNFEYEISVDLRDPVGQDVWPNHSAIFTVTFDGSAWFAGNVLAQAVPSGGQIIIDRLNNVAVGQAIVRNVAAAISLSTAPGPN